MAEQVVFGIRPVINMELFEDFARFDVKNRQRYFRFHMDIPVSETNWSDLGVVLVKGDAGHKEVFDILATCLTRPGSGDDPDTQISRAYNMVKAALGQR